MGHQECSQEQENDHKGRIESPRKAKETEKKRNSDKGKKSHPWESRLLLILLGAVLGCQHPHLLSLHKPAKTLLHPCPPPARRGGGAPDAPFTYY